MDYYLLLKYCRRQCALLPSSSVRRILKRGGYFERVRSVQTTLTRIFIDLESVSDGLSETWGEMSRKARKFKGFFRPKLGDLQKKKKKKGLRQNSEWFFGRNPKFKGFFPPKIRSSHQKKKKKRKVFTQGPSRFSPELTPFSSRKPDAQLTKGGAMPQFCSLYYAILHS